MPIDGRRNDQLCPVKNTPGYIEFPKGSALIESFPLMYPLDRVSLCVLEQWEINHIWMFHL